MTTIDWLNQKPTQWNRIGRGKKATYLALGKRLLDLALTLPALILCAPLFALLALLVRIKLGRPIFFRQERPGLYGRPFTMIKFRTMTDDRDAEGNLLPDHERMTPLGRLLRSTSLDELPELFNVLKGEMSLVGPRPLLLRYMPYFMEHERVRFAVMPGITGWAQIHGRNGAPWDERFADDVWYVENQSLLLDLRIMVRTVLQVLRCQDVEPDPQFAVGALDEERRQRAVYNTTFAS
jgi:lipopolysaccharide/colanic/teichoic acid biosynthesis glycosyltransferase